MAANMKAVVAELEVGQKFQLLRPAGKSPVLEVTQIVSTKFGFSVSYTVEGTEKSGVQLLPGNTEIEVIP